MKHLILGGARSGKSAFAESQALHQLEQKQLRQQALNCWYVATATVGDDHEMLQRIEHHKNTRDDRWQLIEEPLQLATVIQRYNSTNDCLLIDCLTLWLTNALLADEWPIVKREFLHALSESQAQLYFVSNEVGSGVVPLGELSRQFVDESGWLHQTLAEQCDRVTLVIAGLPMKLKA